MKIRKEQMASFEEMAWADFYPRLVEFLRTEMPDQTVDMSDLELSEFVSDAQAKSQAHGIESEASVAQFACLSLEAGLDFADDPEIAEFLHQPNTEPEEQLDALVDKLADEDDLEDRGEEE